MASLPLTQGPPSSASSASSPSSRTGSGRKPQLPFFRPTNIILWVILFLVLFFFVFLGLILRPGTTSSSSSDSSDVRRSSLRRPEVADQEGQASSQVAQSSDGGDSDDPFRSGGLSIEDRNNLVEGLKREIASLRRNFDDHQKQLHDQKEQVLFQLEDLRKKTDAALRQQKKDQQAAAVQPVVLSPVSPSPPPSSSSSSSSSSPPSPSAEAVAPVNNLPGLFPPEPKTQRATLDPINEQRRQSVKDGFLHCWNSYKRFAWGFDELDPVSKRGKDWLALAATIVDSLDTLWIMDLKDEFKLARDYVANELSFSGSKTVSVFETCIRDLGGLLAAYEFSRDKMFLYKAEDLAERLLKAFNTQSGLPRASVNLANGAASNPSWTGGSSILSEMGTMQLEFTYLAYHTRKPELAAKVNNVFRHLDRLNKPNPGLYPLYVDPRDGNFRGVQVSLGALGDSFYEYMIKMWVFTGKKIPGFRRMYDESSDGINNVLVQRSNPSDLVYVAELSQGGGLHHKMDELACFTGGMFALGAVTSPDAQRRERDLKLGKELTRTCYEFWHRMPTGIAPELVNFNYGNDFSPGHNARHYLLRPETVESLFVLYRTTGDPIYQEWGWEIWSSILKHCKTPNGFSGLRDVTNAANPQWDDTQQSFFLAETLKYLYLLFSPTDLIPLDKYVFNTEAHPLGVIDNYDWPASYTNYFP